jgi:hypothetical protein
MRSVWPAPRTVPTVCATLIALASALAGTGPARAADEGTVSPSSRPPVARAQRGLRSRDPAAVLAQRLDLDPKQQAQVQRLLAMRQAQIRGVWTNPGIAGDDRIGAVKAINDRTVAQIRALLTDEQKTRYFQPRPAGSPAKEAQPSVQDWLNATRPRNSDPSTPR